MLLCKFTLTGKAPANPAEIGVFTAFNWKYSCSYREYSRKYLRLAELAGEIPVNGH